MDSVATKLSSVNSLAQTGWEFFITYGPKVLGAILVLLIGLWLINRVVKVFQKVMRKRGLDESLIPFLSTLTDIGLKAMLIISAASMIGIETTSFIAVLGAAGLAVGLALQGTLQNFAGGVLILIFKPYKVGHLIEAQSHLGTVKEIQIFVTILLTPENKTIIIPNGAISNGSITNYTVEGVIRVDVTFNISYESNIKIAKDVLSDILANHPKVLQTPAPFVGVKSLGDNAIVLTARPYSHPSDYWDVYFDVIEAGKIALDNAGINIPFPQMDVYLKGENKK